MKNLLKFLLIHQTFVKIDESSPKIYENSLKSIKSMKIRKKLIQFIKINENSIKIYKHR